MRGIVFYTVLSCTGAFLFGILAVAQAAMVVLCAVMLSRGRWK